MSTGQLLLCLRGYAEMEEREGCRHLRLWWNVLELKSCCFLIATPPQVNTIDEQLPLRRGVTNLEGGSRGSIFNILVHNDKILFC